MATRRKTSGKEEQSSEQSKSSASNGSTAARKRKLRSDLPKESGSTIRWLLTFLLLALGILALAYYVSYYGSLQVALKATPGAANSTVTDKAAKTKDSAKSEKTNPKKAASGDGKTGKTKGTKKQKKDAKNPEKKKPESKPEPPENQPPPPPRGSQIRRKDKYVNMSTVDLSAVPVLQWPIPPSDPDRPFIIEILTGEKALSRKKYKQALDTFDGILARFPQSPRGMFGKAETLCRYSEVKRSNKFLDLCIDAYWNIGIDSIVVGSEVRRVALLRLAERASFRGKMQTCVKAWMKLEHFFPNNRDYARQVGLQWLLANKDSLAREQFESLVAKWPDDLFSKAHVGLLLKKEGNLVEALPMLLDGLRNDEEIRKMAEFFQHAGECLTQLGRSEEAYVLYAEGVSLGHFQSPWQRSLHAEPDLRAQPWWLPGETYHQALVKLLEDNWEKIRNEALSVLDSFQEVAMGSCEMGKLSQLLLYLHGKRVESGCGLLPQTCALIGSISSATSCKRGQVKLLMMDPGTRVWPAVADSNIYLSLHLGLQTPSGSGIRVADNTRSWAQGKVIAFDRSFEHELWHKGVDNPWVVLAVDVWHPDLPEDKQKLLSHITIPHLANQ